MASTLIPRAVIVDGTLARTYTAAVPAVITGPTPVVFVFHGGGQTALSMQESCKIEQTTQGSQVVVVYPQGYQNNWNTGGGTGNPAYSANIDDIGFVQAMIADIATFVNIDRTRIYAAGYSNGGSLCYVLAAQMPHTLAAICTNCSAMWIPTSGLTVANPIPIWILHGDADQICPYAGGNTVEGVAPPVATTVSWWATVLSATYAGSQSLWLGGAEEKFYVNGAGKLILRNDIVAHMGHRWTGNQYVPGQSAFFIHGNQSLPLGPFSYPQCGLNFDNSMISWMLEFTVT